MALEHAHGHGPVGTHGDHAAHEPHGHDHHVLPVSLYLKTFITLLVLMVLTIVAAQYNFGPMNNVIAMVIAVTKAVLVVLFFMGVKYGTRLTWLWAALGFVWFLLLFGIGADYISREWVPSPGWEHAAPAAK